MDHSLLITALFLIFLSTPSVCSAAGGSKLRADDFVAVVGDSITEQRLSSMFMEMNGNDYQKS